MVSNLINFWIYFGPILASILAWSWQQKGTENKTNLGTFLAPWAPSPGPIGPGFLGAGSLGALGPSGPWGAELDCHLIPRALWTLGLRPWAQSKHSPKLLKRRRYQLHGQLLPGSLGPMGPGPPGRRWDKAQPLLLLLLPIVCSQVAVQAVG